MVHSTLLVALLALSSGVYGHYNFVRLAVNGKWAAPLQYIRNHTHDYMEDSTPGGSNQARTYETWVNPGDRSESLRCGRDNLAWAKDTEVLSVRAGDQMEFAALSYSPSVWKDENFNCPDGKGTCDIDESSSVPYPWVHDGPVVVHISRVPDGEDVRSYDGAGEWIKIHTLGLELNKDPNYQPLRWLPRYGAPVDPITYKSPMTRIIFSLPKEIPKGKYLIRVASIYPGTVYNYSASQRIETQLYHHCAHLNIDSDADGTLPKGVLIPDAFRYGQDGLEVSNSMYQMKTVDNDYRYPGGPLWTGKELVDDKPTL